MTMKVEIKKNKKNAEKSEEKCTLRSANFIIKKGLLGVFTLAATSSIVRVTPVDSLSLFFVQFLRDTDCRLQLQNDQESRKQKKWEKEKMRKNVQKKVSKYALYANLIDLH